MQGNSIRSTVVKIFWIIWNEKYKEFLVHSSINTVDNLDGKVQISLGYYLHEYSG